MWKLGTHTQPSRYEFNSTYHFVTDLYVLHYLLNKVKADSSTVQCPLSEGVNKQITQNYYQKHKLKQG